MTQFDACCSFGLTPIISFKGIYCLCTVHRQLYNHSAFEHVQLALNPDPDLMCKLNFPLNIRFTSLIYFLRGPQGPRKIQIMMSKDWLFEILGETAVYGGCFM